MKQIILLLMVSVVLIMTGCAPKTTIDTTIMSEPLGANITVNGKRLEQPTPVRHIFYFANGQQYELTASKEGYFEEEYTVKKELPTLKDGFVSITLTRSPLWEATTNSAATNNWIQVLVGADIDARTAWQIMIDAVIKRSSNIKELNYESGYLQTKYTVKKFDTKNGEFLLRCQLIANLVSTDPLIYRIKDVAEWSGNGVQWHPYNRIFSEHSEMITEIQDRLGAN